MEINGVVFRLSSHAVRRFNSRFGSENIAESFCRAVPVTTRELYRLTGRSPAIDSDYLHDAALGALFIVAVDADGGRCVTTVYPAKWNHRPKRLVKKRNKIINR